MAELEVANLVCVGTGPFWEMNDPTEVETWLCEFWNMRPQDDLALLLTPLLRCRKSSAVNRWVPVKTQMTEGNSGIPA